MSEFERRGTLNACSARAVTRFDEVDLTSAFMVTDCRIHTIRNDRPSQLLDEARQLVPEDLATLPIRLPTNILFSG